MICPKIWEFNLKKANKLISKLQQTLIDPARKPINIYFIALVNPYQIY